VIERSCRSPPCGTSIRPSSVAAAVNVVARKNTHAAITPKSVSPQLATFPGTLSQAALPKDEALRSLPNVRCPVLAVLGEFDRQGTHRTVSENVDSLRAALDERRNKNSTVKVLNDADSYLADTGPSGSHPSQTAIPPQSVWKTASDWIAKQAQTIDPTAKADTVEGANGREGVPVYPKSIYGEFRFHPWYTWAPAIGDQTRPFGYWYW